MAARNRADRTARRAQARAPLPPAAPVLLSDRQRRVVLALVLSGISFCVVAMLVQPRGAAYWLALSAAPVAAALLGVILGGAPTRAMDARLVAKPRTDGDWRPAPPAGLPPQQRDALQAALLPPLLAELAGAAESMEPRLRTAARALFEAGATAPASEARLALGRDLPRLISSLAARSTPAAIEAEELARRLAQPVPMAGARP